MIPKQGNFYVKPEIFDKPRVVCYCRVSTEHEEQLHAYEQQVMWFDKLIEEHPNWKKIRMYSDRGVTGTSAQQRPGFLKMIEDAKNNEFDIILTREVCRFGRNTVDTLMYTRELLLMGVGVFFIVDNIKSWDSDGELRLTLMAALAQEEARKTSERVLEGQRVSREKHVLFGNGNIIGYRLVRGSVPEENTYVIDPQQAEIIKTVYNMYVHEDCGMRKIAAALHEKGFKNTKGEVKWSVRAVQRILQNRTYCGYIGYHKSSTVSFLGHQRKVNPDRDTIEYVKGNFPAIVTEEDP